MPKSAKQLISTIPGQQEILAIPLIALRSVTSKTGWGVYASSDHLFKGAVFGRDSLDVAEDLMAVRPKLVRNILLTLAHLQGLHDNPINEELPGKIVHEYRNVIVDGKPIDDHSMHIFQALSQKWGGNDTEMAYYGSIDATPHYLRTLGRYVATHNPRFSDHKIGLRDGTTTTIRDVAERAAQRVLDDLAASRSGLLEYMKRNPHGISNQVWKDSEEFYVHENKEMANHNAPIASIEVQGLAYDGLMAAAILIPERAGELRAAAVKLRDRTIELLWQEDRRFFALGTDFDPDGSLRIIHTSTANPAALLDTEFFDDMPPEDRQKYVSALIEHIMSGEFLTDAGIRSRSLNAAKLVDFWDYHGAYVTWPKETYDIAKGMRRQGFTTLAHQLENRILNVFLKNRHYPEFVYVDGHGRVLAGASSTHGHGELILVDSTNQPERIQAWTVSAVIAIMNSRLIQRVKKKKQTTQDTWKQELETRILTNIHRVKVYANPMSLSARYPSYPYRLTSRKK